MATRKKKDVSSTIELEDGVDPIDSILSSELVKAIHKKHGKGILGRGSDLMRPTTPRIPTNCFELDFALGGGYPVGKASMNYGNASGGKTTMFIRALANAQKMCANCWQPPNYFTGESNCICGEYRKPVIVVLNPEGTWDMEWATYHGMDQEDLIYSVPDHGEQTWDQGEHLLRSAAVDIMLIDSIAQMQPAREIEDETKKENPGIAARMNNKGFRKFISAVNYVATNSGRRPTLFFVNQLREKVGVMFGNPETLTGGKGQEFVMSILVKAQKPQYEMNSEDSIADSVLLRYRIEKNKVMWTRPKFDSEVRLNLRNTENRVIGESMCDVQLIKWGLKIGVIDQVGAKLIVGEESFYPKSVLGQRLVTDKEFFYNLKAQILDKAIKMA